LEVPIFDVAIVVVVAVQGQLDTWLPAITRSGGNVRMVGSAPVNAACLALTAVLLLWRRRAPLGVLVAIMLVSDAQALLEGASQGLGVFFPILIGTYSVARYADRRTALTGLSVAVLGFVVHDLRDPNVSAVAEVFFLYLILAGTWAAGAALHGRAVQGDELMRRAADAERDIAEQAEAAVRSERTRIARELHDVVAHHVSVMAVQASAGVSLLDSGDTARARMTLRTVEDTARQALGEMRRLLGILRAADPPDTTPQPGLTTVSMLVDQIRRAGLPVELAVEGERRPLPAGVDLSAYRIVQEALTNALKHAGPVPTHVQIRYGAQSVEVEVWDQGSGLSAEAVPGAGQGLIGMQERVALYGGTFESGPRPGAGFAIRARLPVPDCQP